jgi:hypothetical protein
MFTKTTLAAALISLTTLAAVPAQASDIAVEIGIGAPDYSWSGGHGHGRGHGGYHRMHRLSTEEVRWMLRDSGYRQIRFFDDYGPVYQIRARRHGDTFFLAISARTGEILSRNRI